MRETVRTPENGLQSFGEIGMMDQTKIEWTDFTVNAWEGCQKVGPGCDHCYAEARDNRFTGGKHWGPGAPRRKVKSGKPKLRRINRNAPTFFEHYGRWPRVFCSSLSDVFDNAAPKEWRIEFLNEISLATNTCIQLLTKRVGNVFQMVPPLWATQWPSHVGLMITVVNQAEADRDIPKLLELKARLGIPWVGLSIEPMLAPIDLTEVRTWRECNIPEYGGAGHEHLPCLQGSSGGVDWVICGGESGHNARPMHPDWARSLRDQCAAAKTSFHFKQWGEWGPCDGPMNGDIEAGILIDNHGQLLAGRGPGITPDIIKKVGKKAAGRLLDGRIHDGMIT
ncbi:MAG: phage Gp37/Gp68 family protein [Sulfitobacter sp.]